MSDWLPIESAPKDGSTFIITCRVGENNPRLHKYWQFALAFWRLDGVTVPRWRVSDGGNFDAATHWMPLPAAPMKP